jgi:hypothetical protein
VRGSVYVVTLRGWHWVVRQVGAVRDVERDTIVAPCADVEEAEALAASLNSRERVN